MNTIICDLIVNIVASIVFDLGKHFVFKRKLKTEDIFSYIQERIPSNLSFIDDSESVLYFLKLPQVTDVIRGYLLYKISGEITLTLRKNFEISAENKLYQVDVVAFLVKGYFSRMTITLTPAIFVEKLLNGIANIIRQYILEHLDTSDKVMIYLINDNNDRNSNKMKQCIESMADHVLGSIKYDIHPHLDEMAKVKEKYEKIMIDKFSRAHIYLLDYFDFNKFYVPPILSNESKTFNEDAWKHIFDEDRIVYIIGGTGYGKSLFLKNIVLNYYKMNLLGNEERLFVHGDLKNFIDQNGNTKPVIQFLQESMINATGMSYRECTEEFIRYYLESGSCVILLDALDELREDKRNDVHLTVISYFAHSNPNNKICITSRDRGFVKMYGDCVILNILPLTSKQVESYIDNIINIKKFNDADRADFLERTKPLMRKGFLSSCLILSLLVNIYKAERALPDNKLELYQKCFEYISYKREIDEKKSLLYNWDRVYPLMNEDTFTRLSQLCAPNNQDVDADTVKAILLNANTKIFESTASASIAVNEFLKFCASRTELFISGDKDNSYRFFHRSFLDYFYSLYIYKYIDNLHEMYSKLCSFGFDSEIFELLLTLLKNKKRDMYENLIEYVIKIAREDLVSNSTTFVPLNMLILFMQEITEKVYESEIMDLVLSHSRTIVNKTSIINRKVDERVIDYNNVIYYILNKNLTTSSTQVKRFIDNYEEGSMSEIIYAADKIQRVSSSTTQYIPMWFKYINDTCSFYTVAYIKICGKKCVLEKLRSINIKQFTNVDKQARQAAYSISKVYSRLTEREKVMVLCRSVLP